MEDCSAERRSQTVPICGRLVGPQVGQCHKGLAMIARPIYMAMRMPYAITSRYDLIHARCKSTNVTIPTWRFATEYLTLEVFSETKFCRVLVRICVLICAAWADTAHAPWTSSSRRRDDSLSLAKSTLINSNRNSAGFVYAGKG
jgi:hypothetical protein